MSKMARACVSRTEDVAAREKREEDRAERKRIQVMGRGGGGEAKRMPTVFLRGVGIGCISGFVGSVVSVEGGGGVGCGDCCWYCYWVFFADIFCCVGGGVGICRKRCKSKSRICVVGDG